MALFDPNLRGKYIKLGRPAGLVKVSDIVGAARNGGRTQITVNRSGGQASLVVNGIGSVERIRAALVKEGKTVT